MPRPKTLPRIDVEGKTCIEILRVQSLRKLAVDKLPLRDMLTAVIERFYENITVVKKFFELQNDMELFIVEDGDDFVWAVPESKLASSINHVLHGRASRCEKLAVTRTNEYAEHLGGSYYEVAKEEGP